MRLLSKIQFLSNFERAINDIPLATVHTICRSFRLRFWEFTVAEGGRFEHVRA